MYALHICVYIINVLSLCVCLSMYLVQRLKTTTIRDSSGYKCSATDSHVLAVRVSFSPSPSSPHFLPLLGKCSPLTVPLWVVSITTLHMSPLTDFPSEGRSFPGLHTPLMIEQSATVYAGFNAVFVMCLYYVCGVCALILRV